MMTEEVNLWRICYLQNTSFQQLESFTNAHCKLAAALSLGTLVPNSRDRQGKLWLPKKQKTALKTILQ